MHFWRRARVWALGRPGSRPHDMVAEVGECCSPCSWGVLRVGGG